ncbi:MAG: acetolactate synthase large subunit [Candidatus Anammoxibacter sp.]
MKASDLFVKCLENEGVEYIFGVPGEENMDFLESLRTSSIKFITTRHEQGAAFMADVYGRLTGKAGVCLATLGPGATNLFTGIADANMDNAPLVAITGQSSLASSHRESHQYIDVVDCFKPVTKWTTRITRAIVIPEVIRKAFKLAEMEKPGACHIELAEDVAKAEVDASPLPIGKMYYSMPNMCDIQRAANLINESKHPIVLSGNGVVRGRASRALRAFAEKTNIAVAATFMGKGSISYRDKHSLMSIGLQAHDYISCGFNHADLIIAIGYDFVEYAPQFLNPDRDKKIIHIDFMSSEVDDCYATDVELVGKIEDSILSLTELVDCKEDETYNSSLREQILNELCMHKDSNKFPLVPQKILFDVRNALNDDDILISDVGAHKLWISRMYPAYEPNTVIISNGFATMGFSLPGAIAAKLVNPDKNVVAICGDGGFMMNDQELETACRLKLNIVIIIFTDSEYGLIAWKQMTKFNNKFGISFNNPDFVALAKAYGAHGYKIKEAKELPGILKKSLEHDMPVIIDVPVDYSENLKLTEKLGKLVCPI